MNRIVILASGSGSNAENIINYFEKTVKTKVVCVLTNKVSAGVIDRCNRLKVPCLSFNKAAFIENETVLSVLKSLKPSLIVLAGFLWKIPENLILSFPDKIINIHPSLLPKYGGKGMYGDYVHEAVKLNNETETGITIHYVNNKYDDGTVIFQKSTQTSTSDSAIDIASKVHALEYEHFPKIIEQLLEAHG